MANLTGNVIVSVGISSGEYTTGRDTKLIKNKKGLFYNKQSFSNTADIIVNKNYKDNQKAVGYIDDRIEKDIPFSNKKLKNSYSMNVNSMIGYYNNTANDYETEYFLNMEEKNIKKYSVSLTVLDYNRNKQKIKNNWYIQTTKNTNYFINRETNLFSFLPKNSIDIFYVKKENFANSTGSSGGSSSIENFDGLELVFPLQKYTSVKIRFKMESVVEFFDLPEGIVFNNTTKEIQGVPIKAGTFISKVRVNNEKEYKILINIPYFTRTSLI